ncbi:hypothetical protein [Pseudoalteromonas luteoviolacea]|uniref:Uncharacterized protein n=1 Tax=Pseudoalteromonas luteoviolacea H33 TaxID=1365251 RepID=A0A167DMY2_9GAMM|nr:hypothetical protein [Pseudoalteromonas luteoviolacea]KZN49077.1 hypothetical protein N476_20420 [Pseudoalteromonas luteoviolacea H33]KZN75484.1 hypothetical protein N477_18730 [Pseudoalteromonas luteoviolacea H33-S]MBQ4878787.1 hypothetical protein [Pseudoalteromonas luteoviolacea]MBQ4907805.1 hypothetical protein [Pseudoalteromonas luteoviolacea]
MKLKIKKNNLKALSKNQQSLNAKQTKEINGGVFGVETWKYATHVDVCKTNWARCEP